MSMLCVVDLGHFVSLGPQAQKSQVVSMSGRGPRYCKYPATRPLSAFSIEFMAFLLEREEEKKKCLYDIKSLTRVLPRVTAKRGARIRRRDFIYATGPPMTDLHHAGA